jgi:hypothetical protein
VAHLTTTHVYSTTHVPAYQPRRSVIFSLSQPKQEVGIERFF